MIKSFLLFLSIIAFATTASVKREEYNPDSLLGNQVNGNRDSSSVTSNNSPVYNPNNAYSSYSSSYGNPVLSNSNQNVASNNAALSYGSQADANANQAYFDNVASAASNLQSSNLPSIAQSNQPAYSNNQQQGNLYYYYYPVQDKSKEINYQASPSNQYTSSISQPQSNDDQSNQNNANLANSQQLGNSPNHAGQDLSYGGSPQDLAYTASALNENANNGQANNNYENQLTNLASQLNQYGFGSNANAFGSQFSNQFSGLNGLNGLTQGFGEAFGGSIPQPSSVPFVNDPAFSAAMASQLGNFQPSSNSGPSGGGGGPLSQLYQQATQMYQGLLNGNSVTQPQFAASQQHSSYEPSTGGGSSFRSKYGLGTIIMPLMALAGLSLLIPSVTSLSTIASRKKRSAERDDAGLGSSYLERIDRYYSLYKNSISLEREECMNRIICELGDAVSGVRGKDAFFE